MMSENKSTEISQAERLSAAIRAGDADGVKAFIDAGGDVNCRNLDNVTPLHTAAQYGDLDIVRMLVGAGADVLATVESQCYDEKYNAASFAYMFGYKDIYKFLDAIEREQIKKRREAQRPQRERLFAAINAQQPDAVRRAAAEGADVNEREEFVADCGGDTKNRILLTPLCAAIKNGGNAEVVKTLLEAGADAKASTVSTMEYSERYSSSDNVYPLFYAVEADNAEVVKLLLSAGADANYGLVGDWDCDSADIEPLYKAVENNNYEIAKLLLEAGACPDAYAGGGKGEWSQSAVACAASKGNADILRLLLDFGAKADFADNAEEMQESDVSPEVLKIIKDAAQKQKRG